MTRNLRKFTCLDCGKQSKEATDLSGFKNAQGENVEIEYHDVCKKCGKIRIKKTKQVYMIQAAFMSGKITDQEIKDWQSKKLSPRVFFEKINSHSGDLKLRNEKIKNNLLNKNQNHEQKLINDSIESISQNDLLKLNPNDFDKELNNSLNIENEVKK